MPVVSAQSPPVSRVRSVTCSELDLDACNAAISRICGPYRVVHERWREFRGRVEALNVGTLQVADLSFSGGRVIREQAHRRDAGNDCYFLVLQMCGWARMHQRGTEALLQRGDCTLIDSRLPSVFELGPDSRQYSFHLPAELFRRRFGDRVLPVAQTICGQRGPSGVLSDTLISLVRHASDLHGSELTDLALHLLSAALGASVLPPCPMTERTAVDARQVIGYIDERIELHQLAPSAIASHFNVSLRQLYRLVADAGYTPAALIWTRRLERARQLLAEPAMAAFSITEIALRCGFKDAAHFSRAYRKHFGQPPRASRRSMSIAGGAPPPPITSIA
jgi:AraC-like DNA-binding protein